MASKEVETVKAFIQAINTRNIDSLGSLMADDHSFVDGNGRVTIGKDILLASWPQYFKMFPDYRIDIETVLGEGSLIAVFGQTTATYQGQTDNKVAGPAAWRVEVIDGKVKTWQVYADYTETWKIVEAHQEKSHA